MGGYGSYLGFRIKLSDDPVSSSICLTYMTCAYNAAQFLPVLQTHVIWTRHPQEEKTKAKDLHPKLLGGMFFFFALGATGGVTALLTSGKPIFERYSYS